MLQKCLWVQQTVLTRLTLTRPCDVHFVVMMTLFPDPKAQRGSSSVSGSCSL